jgi:hypothetical protein
MRQWELRVRQKELQTDACRKANTRGWSDGGELGKAFGNLCSADEAIAAQDETTRY